MFEFVHESVISESISSIKFWCLPDRVPKIEFIVREVNPNNNGKVVSGIYIIQEGFWFKSFESIHEIYCAINMYEHYVSIWYLCGI